jgi:RNA recognition motif-containing protein|eukprot:TRINITY_DN16012_c0_g1_i1.p1 TRINITY_DN16012_c0_g1~~TRINITY_DN16012_c0_g1_i1.p1  ORF type:complete len:257 (-),score=44.33 TRINITY_DN16012_c0_g1_i1:156-926(-)
MHVAMSRPGTTLPPRYGEIPPNQTLYVNNLNEKTKIPELKCLLMELFSTYGEVVDIVAWAAKRKIGQAFVVFRDISCATNALRALQGFQFMDKPLGIHYAKSKSDFIAHEDGTFKPRAKAGMPGKEDDKKRTPPPPLLRGVPGKGGVLGVPMQRTPLGPKSLIPHPGAGALKGADADGGQPSNVLFVENLPPEVNEMMLKMLFRQYPGFQEARPIKGRNVAFIEYADELQAGIAKHGLQGFMVTPEMALKISFAKP